MSDEAQTPEIKNIVTVEDAGPCKKKVTVEVPQETITAILDENYRELRRDSVVPGFRKGRAPLRLLEKKFGKDVSQQVKLKILATASEDALKDNDIDMLGEPDVDYENIELPETGPMKFDFEVEVRPEFELPKLEGIAVEKTKLEVKKEQIDEEVTRLQKQAGIWSPVDGGIVEDQDQVVADVEIKPEDAEEEQRYDNTEISVQPNGFVHDVAVNELDKLLIGAKASDVKETTVDLPETYFKEEYRGKKIALKITIKEVKRLVPAEVNEDFLKRLGLENEEELRERVEEMLQGRLEQDSKRQMGEQVYAYLNDNIDFELPTDVVADQSARLMQRQASYLMMQGLPKEMVTQQMETMRAGSEEDAKKQLKIFFVMDKIAEKLDISVTDEEVNGHIAQAAIQQSRRPEKVREDMIRDGSLAQFGMQVREQKCIDKLLEDAKITEVAAKKAAKKDVKKTAKKKETPDRKPPAKKKVVAKKKTAKKKTEE